MNVQTWHAELERDAWLGKTAESSVYAPNLGIANLATSWSVAPMAICMRVTVSYTELLAREDKGFSLIELARLAFKEVVMTE